MGGKYSINERALYYPLYAPSAAARSKRTELLLLCFALLYLIDVVTIAELQQFLVSSQKKKVMYYSLIFVSPA